MAAICIQVINPNTNAGMTDTIATAARMAAAPGTEIMAVSSREGVPSIEGHFDEAIAAVGVLEQIIRYRPAGLGQLVLPLVQQIPKVDRHDLITPYKAGEPGSRCTVLTPVP